MRPTILIAEGDADLCDFYQRSLTRRGYQVETALDALDCLNKVSALRPAVLVLDLELRWGGADGVLAWLRQESALSTVAVILMGSANSPLHVAEDLAPPVVRFLPKPLAVAALLDSVRAALAEEWRTGPFHLERARCSEVFIG